MSSKETLGSIVQRLKKNRAAERKTAVALAAAEQSFEEERNIFEIRGILNPIIETVDKRKDLLEGSGVGGIIDEIAAIYGGPKEWQREMETDMVPLDTLRQWRFNDPSLSEATNLFKSMTQSQFLQTNFYGSQGFSRNTQKV